jgi:hypothetical protein
MRVFACARGFLTRQQVVGSCAKIQKAPGIKSFFLNEGGGREIGSLLHRIEHRSRAPPPLSSLPKGGLPTVDQIHEPVFISVLLVHFANTGHRRAQHRAVDKDEQGLIGPHLDPLPNDVLELPHGDVKWHQVFASLRLGEGAACGVTFADDGDHVRILLSHAGALCLPLFERFFALERLELAGRCG